MAQSDVNRLLFEETKKIYNEIVAKEPKVKRFMDLQATGSGARIMVPYWFSIFENGRGPRKSPVSSRPSHSVAGVELNDFEYNLYNWMSKKGKLRGTGKQKIAQVKSLRWYINKHGNEQYQKGIKKDVYDSIITEERTKRVMESLSTFAQIEAFSQIKNI